MIPCPAKLWGDSPASPGDLTRIAGSTHQMTFANPFHPDTLKMLKAVYIRWTATGPNQWVGTDLAS